MLSQDFKEFIQLLNANEVRYLVVGGYAVAVHGYPRYTKDIDIWLDTKEDNAARVMKVLDHFGFGSLGLEQSDFMSKEQVIQLGYPPNRIDLMTSADGVNFESCYRNRATLDIDGLLVNFIGVEDLKVNKHTTGRKQDLADLAALQQQE